MLVIQLMSRSRYGIAVRSGTAQVPNMMKTGIIHN
jgi:hypothetical protein